MGTRQVTALIYWLCRFAIVGSFIAIFLASLSGCRHAPVTTIVTKSETELAVAAIKSAWLERCEAPALGLSNNIGNLLQEYTDLAASLAVCMRRHNDFVDYLGPVVAKEKAK